MNNPNRIPLLDFSKLNLDHHYCDYSPTPKPLVQQPFPYSNPTSPTEVPPPQPTQTTLKPTQQSHICRIQ